MGIEFRWGYYFYKDNSRNFSNKEVDPDMSLDKFLSIMPGNLDSMIIALQIGKPSSEDIRYTCTFVTGKHPFPPYT